ncbi:MAG: ATP-dependent nuclease [Promethearchaeota archaeon]
MKISKVEIKNYRSIKNAKFNAMPYLVFVGKNNSGKSNILKALDVFFNGKPSLDDFYLDPISKKYEKKIEITVTFRDFNEKERNNFGQYITSEVLLMNRGKNSKKTYKFESLTIQLEITREDNKPKEYFQALMKSNNADDSTIEKKKLPKTIRNRFGHFFFIPAVQDIEKETSYRAKGDTNMSKLMNFVLDKILDQEAIRSYMNELGKLLEEIYRINEEGSPLKEIETLLTKSLLRFDGSKIIFAPRPPDIKKLIREAFDVHVDDGVETPIPNKGHGLQRYFLVTLFKALAEKQVELMQDESIFFAIEEPELFLHPQYQRIMRDYLQDLSKTEGNQVLLNTHSPNFIQFYSFNQIIRVEKKDSESGTKLIQPKLSNWIEVWGNDNELRKHFKRLGEFNMNYYLNPNRCEIFFADKVVLVEGQTDKVLLQAFSATFLKNKPEILNVVSFIDCLGKFNMENYIKIVGEFKIPFVVIYDSDNDKDTKTKNMNRYIDKMTKKYHGTSIMLDPDIEGELNIPAEFGADNKKRNKPYNAYRYFFNEEGNFKNEDLMNAIKSHEKIRKIFTAIYEKLPWED